VGQGPPPGLADGYVWGELIGVLAVYFLSASLLTATRAHLLEPCFGGLDRMYLWHRRTAVVGALLLIPHKLVTGTAPDEQANRVGVILGVLSALGLAALVVVSLPRAGRLLRFSYERWLLLHRFTGLFVIIGALHGLLVDRVIVASTVLRVVFLFISLVGVSAYLYTELVMRRVEPSADYTVAAVQRPDEEVLEVQLAPVGTPLRPRAGQFIFLSFGGDDRWREHPFSVAGVAADGALRLAIRALGADTRRLHERLRPGMNATVTGPFGMFDQTLGGPRQVWVAGGIGVVPFLSWLAEPAPGDGRRVDFFYSASSEAAATYLPEIRAAEAAVAGLQVHPVLTDSAPRLTARQILDTVGGPPADLHVFLCGPQGLVDDLSRGLRRAGVARGHLHAEEYAFR